MAAIAQWETTMCRSHAARSWPSCLAVVTLLGLIGCKPPAASDADRPPATRPTGPAVTLVVDFDDGLEKHYRLPWRESMTVLDALEAASRRQRGIDVDIRGRGAMAMVTAIDGLPNEGGEGRNWIYRVNGQLADKGCGVYETKAEDVIIWSFGKYDKGERL